jgi:hypothetical protein
LYVDNREILLERTKGRIGGQRLEILVTASLEMKGAPAVFGIWVKTSGWCANSTVAADMKVVQMVVAVRDRGATK